MMIPKRSRQSSLKYINTYPVLLRTAKVTSVACLSTVTSPNGPHTTIHLLMNRSVCMLPSIDVRPPDVFHDLFRRFLHRPGFLSHLRSLKGYDEPEILPSSTRPICLIGADAGQPAVARLSPMVFASQPTATTARAASTLVRSPLLQKFIRTPVGVFSKDSMVPTFSCTTMPDSWKAAATAADTSSSSLGRMRGPV